MPSRFIPLFPLQVVVFPRTQLPLHIFEDRYKKMVGDAIRENSEFGIVLAREDGIVNAGCTVSVEKIQHLYPDGRMDIVTRGVNRFEIVSLDEEADFLRAEVSFFDDDDLNPVPTDVRDLALAHFEELRPLVNTQSRGEPNMQDPQLSFQLAQTLPDLDFLSTLLRQRSEAGRLRELSQYLEEFIPRQKTVEKARTVAPTNGFGGKHMRL